MLNFIRVTYKFIAVPVEIHQSFLWQLKNESYNYIEKQSVENQCEKYAKHTPGGKFFTIPY
jgi:hypothetical protein